SHSLCLLPRSSTLFPYTTLFRSKLEIGLSLAADPMGGDLLQGTLMTEESMYELYRRSPDSPWTVVRRYDTPFRQVPMVLIANRRSEEHTSELQSRFDLVCRLLLE